MEIEGKYKKLGIWSVRYKCLSSQCLDASHKSSSQFPNGQGKEVNAIMIVRGKINALLRA
jgi:hypothetical protein